MTEVVETYIAPLAGIVQLVVQPVVHFLPSLSVDQVSHLVVPDEVMTFNGIDAKLVVILHGFPQCAAIVHAVRPGNMMEPQQQFVGTGVDVVVQGAEWLTILTRGISACMAAIEANALLVGLMIVYWTPL